MENPRKNTGTVTISGAICTLLAIAPGVANGGPQPKMAPSARRATVVAPDGANFPIALSTGQDVIGGKPAIAFDGVNFLVPYVQGADIYARRVTPLGVVLDSPSIAVSVGLNEASASPSVVFDGTSYLVAWCATRSGTSELYGARVAPSGSVLDPGGVQLTSGANAKIRMPGVSYDGANYLVAWRTNADQIYATRVSPALANLHAPLGIPITGGASYYPSVAFDGSNYLVVWHDSRNAGASGWDIYGARVTKEGSVLDSGGFVICDEPQNQEHTSVGFDGSNYLVAWYDWRPNNDQRFGSVHGARVSPSGAVLDRPSIQIADRARGQGPPTVACGGPDCLVLWNTDYPNEGTKFRLSDVWGRRISSSGAILDPQGIPVATALGHQFGGRAAYGDESYLVAWSESTGRVAEGAIYGQVLLQLPSSPAQPDRQWVRQKSQAARSEADWTAESAPVSSFAGAGLAFSADNSYAFGYKQAIRNMAGAWSSEATFEEGYVYASWASAADDIWIGGWCRGFNRYDGEAWIDVGCFASSGSWSIVTGIWGSSPTDLWASASGGDLLRYDGVHPWATVASGVSYDLSDLWGTSANNIIAVGERGTVLKYNGSDWSLQPAIPTLQRLNAVWGGGPSDFFAVGDWGTILHFNGVAWSVMESGTLQHLYDVWGFSGSDIYAVGFGGTIVHYDGTAWTLESSGTSMDLLAVWGVSSDCGRTVWVSGSGSEILKHVASTSPTCRLTVGKLGAGSGVITSSPAGIDCGSTCAADFADGGVVTLTASASAGSSFAGWFGEGCGGIGVCQTTMSQARSVVATFVLTPPNSFVPFTPCRVLDTRVPTGPTGGAPLAASSQNHFTVAGSCGVPVTARAIVVNLTVVAGGAVGDLRVIGGHLSETITSSLSIPLSRARANNGMVQLSANGDGTIAVINSSTAGVHFILDVSGYYQ